ncbi:MAG: response regulator, partial [Candidatus Abyssubacteria bacterium]|nr:response regulator [Candidatus Abyssubacteria bacterium]
MNVMNLLIVDDEERFLVTTKRLMDKQGATTITCRNGTD